MVRTPGTVYTGALLLTCSTVLFCLLLGWINTCVHAHLRLRPHIYNPNARLGIFRLLRKGLAAELAVVLQR